MIQLTNLAAAAMSGNGHHAPILPIALLVIVVGVAAYFIVRARKRRG